MGAMDGMTMSRRGRVLILLLLLVAAPIYYVSQNLESISALVRGESAQLEDHSASLPLDDETKANIRHYFEGVTLDLQENNLNQAISLDSSVGRPQISQGKYR